MKEKVLVQLGAVLLVIALAVVASIVLCLPIKWLWNWLVPELFNGPKVSLMQAWGLVLLLQLLMPKVSGSAKSDR